MEPVWAWVVAVGLGAFHGVNPGMGWLFAVSNGLQAGHGRAVWAALGPLGAGHFLAMAAVLFPAALVGSFVAHRTGLQFAAAVVLIGFGVYKCVRPRHPRVVARVGPKRLTLWSFLMATAHGAGLMLLPVFFDLSFHAGHANHAAATLPDGLLLGLGMATVHTVAMVATAGLVAWLVFRWLGLRLLRSAWFNTDLAWAVALIAVGLLAVVT